MPRVSVLLPVYNDEAYVGRAVASILCQTFPDFDVVVVDDGSTDRTPEVLAGLSDPRIRVVSQANAGVAAALNAGMSFCGGEFIARMDSDDIMAPDRLERQVSFLAEMRSCGLVGTACDVVSESGTLIRTFVPPVTDRALRRAMVWGNPFVHSSVLMRRSVLDRAGQYRTGVLWEDYDLWWRLMALSDVANLPRVLVTRVHRLSSVARTGKSRHHRAMTRIQGQQLAHVSNWSSALPASVARSAVLWAAYSVYEAGASIVSR